MIRSLIKLAGGALESLGEQYPLIKELQSGRIVVPDEKVKEQLQKQMAERPEVQEMDFHSHDGYAVLFLRTVKSGARHNLTIKIVMEEFLITRDVQRAVLLFPDNLELQSENVVGWVTRGLAASVVNKMAQSSGQAEEVAAKSNGLVELEWPRATLHFGRHPEFSKYMLTRLGPLPSVLDVFEIRECRFEPGQIVLPVKRAGSVAELEEA